MLCYASVSSVRSWLSTLHTPHHLRKAMPHSLPSYSSTLTLLQRSKAEDSGPALIFRLPTMTIIELDSNYKYLPSELDVDGPSH